MKQGQSRVSFYHHVRCRYWDQMRTSELRRDTVPIQSEHRRVTPQRQGGIPESLIRTQGLQVARHWIIHRELVLQRWEKTRLESARWEWVYISRGGGALLLDVLLFTLYQVSSGAVAPYVGILICHSIIKKKTFAFTNGQKSVIWRVALQTRPQPSNIYLMLRRNFFPFIQLKHFR